MVGWGVLSRGTVHRHRPAGVLALPHGSLASLCDFLGLASYLSSGDGHVSPVPGLQGALHERKPTLALQQMFHQWKLQVLLSSPSSLCSFRQLKIDEFESNVNEVKDPYPSADFPGESWDCGGGGGLC